MSGRSLPIGAQQELERLPAGAMHSAGLLKLQLPTLTRSRACRKNDWVGDRCLARLQVLGRRLSSRAQN